MLHRACVSVHRLHAGPAAAAANDVVYLFTYRYDIYDSTTSSDTIALALALPIIYTSGIFYIMVILMILTGTRYLVYHSRAVMSQETV